MRNTAADQVAEVRSPVFTQGQVQLFSSVDRYKRHSDIETDTALLTSPKAADCFRQTFRSEIGGLLPPGAHAERVRVRITRRTRNQPRNLIGTITGSILVAVGGRRIEMHLTETAITGRLVEADVIGLGIGKPVPALQRRLATTVAHRAARL